MVKNLPVMQETRVQSLGLEDLLEKEMALRYYCLENPIDRGAWWATVHGVTKIRYDWSTNTFTFSWKGYCWLQSQHLASFSSFLTEPRFSPHPTPAPDGIMINLRQSDDGDDLAGLQDCMCEPSSIDSIRLRETYRLCSGRGVPSTCEQWSVWHWKSCHDSRGTSFQVELIWTVVRGKNQSWAWCHWAIGPPAPVSTVCLDFWLWEMIRFLNVYTHWSLRWDLLLLAAQSILTESSSFVPDTMPSTGDAASRWGGEAHSEQTFAFWVLSAMSSVSSEGYGGPHLTLRTGEHLPRR